ncbi:WD40-repeat-containing domain protein [Protomyces lactucae-debilis]|uniref:WD40-repeat-containing domain protein n=1 Tax=Protomyces lactucae-debilis TaxID=2754530 RepID=A0A1Y2FS39_PROLT|nr:WD40-repeat-containing domain protein [Protomyces lactucae-debilis]ORY86397.1 WD40-repeat-containing domain protein [Protomyces lactucae-debilis]
MVPLADSTLAISSSINNNILLVDQDSLAVKHTLHKAHDDVITGMCQGNDPFELYTSSRDGTVKLWDARTRRTARQYRAAAGVLSLAHHTAQNKVALGTELKGTDALVSVYDARGSAPLVVYADSHAEDVTSLNWHHTHNLLLSGGGDGIATLFDTNVTDEDDAVLQVINHGASLHVAQFVGKNEVLGISHMETASLYKLSYAQEDSPRDAVKEFGDLRAKLGVDYAISFSSGSEPKLFAGSTETGLVSIIPFNLNTMDFDLDGRLDMEGGTEVIRACYLDQTPKQGGDVLYTCGEDGVLRCFSRTSVLQEEEAKQQRKRELRESKSAQRKHNRFEPYKK